MKPRTLQFLPPSLVVCIAPLFVCTTLQAKVVATNETKGTNVWTLPSGTNLLTGTVPSTAPPVTHEGSSNIWGTLTPYTAKLIGDEDTSLTRTALAEAGKVARTALTLPGRVDRVLTLVERGDLTVQTPLLNLHVRRLERALNRTAGLVAFSALLVAGAVLTASDLVLGRWMMGASVLPLVLVLFSGRRRPDRFAQRAGARAEHCRLFRRPFGPQRRDADGRHALPRWG